MDSSSDGSMCGGWCVRAVVRVVRRLEGVAIVVELVDLGSM